MKETQEIKFYDGVPVPERAYVKSAICRTLAQMKPGQSFFVTDENARDRYATYAGKSGVKLVTRKTDGDQWGKPGIIGYGIWKIGAAQT